MTNRDTNKQPDDTDVPEAVDEAENRQRRLAELVAGMDESKLDKWTRAKIAAARRTGGRVVDLPAVAGFMHEEDEGAEDGSD